MEKFIRIGKDLGLEGDKLLQFAERKEAEGAKKEAEAIEREERNKERELRKLEIEAENKRIEAEKEKQRLDLEAENKRLEVDKDKQRLESERRRMDLESVEAEKRRADKEYEAIRDLFIKEKTCTRELAAHLREQKDQSLQTLADAAKRYLEAHNTKFAHKTQRSYVEERSEESSGERGGASNQPICFACDFKVTEQQGAIFDNPLETAMSKGKSIPSKRAPPRLNIRPCLL